MNTTFDPNPLGDNARSPEEMSKILQEKQVLRHVFYDEAQEYVVTTELNEMYQGWCFRSYVMVNGKETDDLTLAPEEGNIRVEATEEVPPDSFVKRAVEKHLEKCQEVQRYIEAEVTQRKRRKRGKIVTAVVCLLFIALLAGGSYLFLLTQKPKEERHLNASVGEKFEYTLQLPDGTKARVTSPTPAWLKFDENTLRLSGTPPDAERGNVYPLTFTTIVPEQIPVQGSKVKNLITKTLKIVGLDATKGTLLVNLAVKEKFATPQLVIEYSTIRGNVTKDQNGIPTITLKKADVVTVTVVDKNTGETVTQGIINIQLAGAP